MRMLEMNHPHDKNRKPEVACGTGTGGWHYGIIIIIDGETTPTIISFRSCTASVGVRVRSPTTVPLCQGDE